MITSFLRCIYMRLQLIAMTRKIRQMEAENTRLKIRLLSLGGPHRIATPYIKLE